MGRVIITDNKKKTVIDVSKDRVLTGCNFYYDGRVSAVTKKDFEIFNAFILSDDREELPNEGVYKVILDNKSGLKHYFKDNKEDLLMLFFKNGKNATVYEEVEDNKDKKKKKKPSKFRIFEIGKKTVALGIASLLLMMMLNLGVNTFYTINHQEEVSQITELPLSEMFKIAFFGNIENYLKNEYPEIEKITEPVYAELEDITLEEVKDGIYNKSPDFPQEYKDMVYNEDYFNDILPIINTSNYAKRSLRERLQNIHIELYDNQATHLTIDFKPGVEFTGVKITNMNTQEIVDILEGEFPQTYTASGPVTIEAMYPDFEVKMVNNMFVYDREDLIVINEDTHEYMEGQKILIEPYDNSIGLYDPCFPNTIFVANEVVEDKELFRDVVAHEFIHMTQMDSTYNVISESCAEFMKYEYLNQGLRTYRPERLMIMKLMELVGSKSIMEYSYTGSDRSLVNELRPYYTDVELISLLNTLNQCNVSNPDYSEEDNEMNQELGNYLIDKGYERKMGITVDEDSVYRNLDNETLVRYYFNKRKEQIEGSYVEVDIPKELYYQITLEQAMEDGIVKITYLDRYGEIRTLSYEDYKNGNYTNDLNISFPNGDPCEIIYNLDSKDYYIRTKKKVFSDDSTMLINLPTISDKFNEPIEVTDYTIK